MAEKLTIEVFRRKDAESTDETYRYVIRRENELTLKQAEAVYARALEKAI